MKAREATKVGKAMKMGEVVKVGIDKAQERVREDLAR